MISLLPHSNKILGFEKVSRNESTTSSSLLRIQNLRSSQQMAKAMRDATKEMKFMNNQMNLSAMQKIMMEFEKESEMMDMKEEIMNDEDEEEETEMIVNQVLDEIGITLDQSERVPQAAEMESSDDAALQARLGNLRKE
ncbi:16076_t:CDS:2 [Entrophospora sp. SA101]|nr:16076_t:CDS:2 [Entrophospora sp. SA101]